MSHVDNKSVLLDNSDLINSDLINSLVLNNNIDENLSKTIYIITVDKKHIGFSYSFEKAMEKCETITNKLCSESIFNGIFCEISRPNSSNIIITGSKRDFIFWYNAVLHSIVINTITKI
jgi:hypothetical protein